MSNEFINLFSYIFLSVVTNLIYFKCSEDAKESNFSHQPIVVTQEKLQLLIFTVAF